MRCEGAEIAAVAAHGVRPVDARLRLGGAGLHGDDLVVNLPQLLFGQRGFAGADQPVGLLVVLNRLFRLEHAAPQAFEMSRDRRAGLARGVGLQLCGVVDIGLGDGVREFGGAHGIAVAYADVEHERALGAPDLNGPAERARRRGHPVALARQSRSAARERRIALEMLGAHHARQHGHGIDDERLALDVIHETIGILAQRDRLGIAALGGAGIDEDLRRGDIFRRQQMRAAIGGGGPDEAEPDTSSEYSGFSIILAAMPI